MHPIVSFTASFLLFALSPKHRRFALLAHERGQATPLVNYLERWVAKGQKGRPAKSNADDDGCCAMAEVRLRRKGRILGGQAPID